MYPAAGRRARGGHLGEVVVVADAQGEAGPAEEEAARCPARREDVLLVPVQVLLDVRGHVRAVRTVDQGRDDRPGAVHAQRGVDGRGDPGGADRVQPWILGPGQPQPGVGHERGQLVAGQYEFGEHHELRTLVPGQAGEAGRPRGVRGHVGGDAGQLRRSDLHVSQDASRIRAAGRVGAVSPEGSRCPRGRAGGSGRSGRRRACPRLRGRAATGTGARPSRRSAVGPPVRA